MPADRISSFSDLFDAWSEAREYGSKHPDLAEHHTRRYAAFSRAFAVDLKVEPTRAPPVPEWAVATLAHFGRRPHGPSDEPWHTWVHPLALQVEADSRSIHSPFSQYLEAPLGVIAAHDQFGAPIAERVRALRAELRTTALELMRALYPEAARRRVSAGDVRAFGFDPEGRAPDPDDYW